MKLLNVLKVEEVKEKLTTNFENLLKVKDIEVTNGLNYYLAEDIYSQCDVPEFNKSRVDGYAVLFNDCKLAYESSPVVLNSVGELNIGDENKVKLDSGECMYIPTGAMLPENTEAVVMIENVDKLGDNLITVHKSVIKNENITFKGDDIRKNTLMFKKGTKIDERIIGTLCSQGILNIKVYEKLKVFILSSGDELIEHNEKEIIIGQTREINSIFIKNALHNDNFEVVGTKLIKDNKNLYKDTILSIIKDSSIDLVITSGGSSKGDKDFTIDVFEEITKNVFCYGIAIKPGKPTILAENNNKLFIGLPGHPVSSYMVLKHIILHSFYNSISYKNNKKLIGKLKYNVPNSIGREMLCLCKLTKEDNEYIVEPIFYNSSNIGILASAHGYFTIKETREGFNAEESVEVNLF